MHKVKQPKTYDEQIAILHSHGCAIDDEADCKDKLSSIGYYRLSAYFLPFKQKDGTYTEGTSFNTVFRIYEFDRKLRHLLFSAIDVIEIYIRSTLSYYHSEKYGSLGYKDASNFKNKHNHEKFESNLNREISNNSNVPFVKHHMEYYDGNFPIWAAIELFTFGMLSYFYNDLKTSYQKAIARKMGQNNHELASWLRCCTDLRNACAHYSRLYNRIFTATPSGLGLDEREGHRLWGAVLMLRSLYPFPDKWNSEVIPAIFALFDEYKDDLDLRYIAFPKDWKDQLPCPKPHKPIPSSKPL
ncbi:MAG: Abi family protein [Lachnospiraceae bacterium]